MLRYGVGPVQVVVQVGDVLDRGDDEIAILSLLAWLGQEARSKGGAVFQVLFQSPVAYEDPGPAQVSAYDDLCKFNSTAD